MLGRRFEGEDGEVGGRPGIELCAGLVPEFGNARLSNSAAAAVPSIISTKQPIRRVASMTRSSLGLPTKTRALRISRSPGPSAASSGSLTPRFLSRRRALFQLPRMFGIPNVSPFCWKLETWLRSRRFPYEVVDAPDPRKAPKGKLPFIEDAGVRIAVRRSSWITWSQSGALIQINFRRGDRVRNNSA